MGTEADRAVSLDDLAHIRPTSGHASGLLQRMLTLAVVYCCFGPARAFLPSRFMPSTHRGLPLVPPSIASRRPRCLPSAPSARCRPSRSFQLLAEFNLDDISMENFFMDDTPLYTTPQYVEEVFTLEPQEEEVVFADKTHQLHHCFMSTDNKYFLFAETSAGHPWFIGNRQRICDQFALLFRGPAANPRSYCSKWIGNATNWDFAANMRPVVHLNFEEVAGECVTARPFRNNVRAVLAYIRNEARRMAQDEDDEEEDEGVDGEEGEQVDGSEDAEEDGLVGADMEGEEGAEALGDEQEDKGQVWEEGDKQQPEHEEGTADQDHGEEEEEDEDNEDEDGDETVLVELGDEPMMPLGDTLCALIKEIRQTYEKQVVLIIDGYDRPEAEAIRQNELKVSLNIQKTMTRILKALRTVDDDLYKVLISGRGKSALESVEGIVNITDKLLDAAVIKEKKRLKDKKRKKWRSKGRRF